MATAKLTQTFINNLPVPEKGYWINDEAMPGLRLYVGASGSKAYYISYKNAKGKKDSYKIGDGESKTGSEKITSKSGTITIKGVGPILAPITIEITSVTAE